MRNRKANEGAVNKTFSFLENLQDKCDGGIYKDFTTTQLHERNFISKSTYSACVALGIVKDVNGSIEWLKENPNREMCLQILDYLLHRRKQSKVTAIAGLEANTSAVKELIEKFGDYIHHIKKQPQIASNGNLFSEVDTKNDLINKAAFAIAGGMYQDNASSTNVKEPFNIWNDEHVHYQNERIVFAAKDLVNQLLK